ncbi:MAG: 4Fe-4S binding protein [archaeon]
MNYKTGTWKTFLPITDKKKCINCLTCVVYCPENCIKSKKGLLAYTDYGFCKGCGVCAEVCPVKCITMKKVGE